MVVPVIPNVVVIGAPGSGKSVSAARDSTVDFHGAWITADPHRDSLGRMQQEHEKGNLLVDCLSGQGLRYGLLKPSTHPDPEKRADQNMRRAKFFVEVMMRRRGGDIAGSPLMEEHTMNALLLS